MAGSVTCPDPETLRHLASGQLPEAQAVTLNEHVQQCSSCTQLLSGKSDGSAGAHGHGMAAYNSPAVRPRLLPIGVNLPLRLPLCLRRVPLIFWRRLKSPTNWAG